MRLAAHSIQCVPFEPGIGRPDDEAAIAQQLVLPIERDAAANLYMTLPGRDPTAKRLVVGSHLDSVPHGGNFDGAAGVVAGLVAIAALQPCALNFASWMRPFSTFTHSFMTSPQTGFDTSATAWASGISPTHRGFWK